MKYFTASTWSRVGAHWVDNIITAVFYSPVFILGQMSFNQMGYFEIPWWVFICSVALDFVFRVLFYYFIGATPGKLLFGLRLIPSHLINSQESSLSFWQCLLRVWADKLSFFFSYAPQALMFFRYDRTHLSDWIAETRVVQLFPRARPPKRRWILAILLILIGYSQGTQNIYQWAGGFEWNSESLIIKTSQ